MLTLTIIGATSPRLPLFLLLATLLLWSATTINGSPTENGGDAVGMKDYYRTRRLHGIQKKSAEPIEYHAGEDEEEEEEEEDNLQHRHRRHSHHGKHWDDSGKGAGGSGWLWLFIPLAILFAIGIIAILSFILIRLARMETIFVRAVSNIASKAYGKAMSVRGGRGQRGVGRRKKNDDLEVQMPDDIVDDEDDSDAIDHHHHQNAEYLRYGLYGGSMCLFDPAAAPSNYISPDTGGDSMYHGDERITYIDADGNLLSERFPVSESPSAQEKNGLDAEADGSAARKPLSTTTASLSSSSSSLVDREKLLRRVPPQRIRNSMQKNPLIKDPQRTNGVVATPKPINAEDGRRLAAANAFKEMQKKNQLEKQQKEAQRLADNSWLANSRSSKSLSTRQPTTTTSTVEKGSTVSIHQNDSIRKRALPSSASVVQKKGNKTPPLVPSSSSSTTPTVGPRRIPTGTSDGMFVNGRKSGNTSSLVF